MPSIDSQPRILSSPEETLAAQGRLRTLLELAVAIGRREGLLQDQPSGTEGTENQAGDNGNGPSD